MKLKIPAVILICSMLLLISCGEDRTYIPGIDDIADNLRAAGYEVYEYDELELGGISYDVMGVNAVKGYNFIDLCLEADSENIALIADYYNDYYDAPEYIYRLAIQEAVICCDSDKPLRAAGIMLSSTDRAAK